LQPTLADGLSGGYAPLAWKLTRDRLDRVVLVEEEQIASAMRVFQQEEQLMLEGSAAVGLAALLHGEIDLAGQKVVLVLTGRNIDAANFNQVVCHA
jgi:threonine dehydratase